MGRSQALRPLHAPGAQAVEELANHAQSPYEAAKAQRNARRKAFLFMAVSAAWREPFPLRLELLVDFHLVPAGKAVRLIRHRDYGHELVKHGIRHARFAG